MEGRLQVLVTINRRPCWRVVNRSMPISDAMTKAQEYREQMAVAVRVVDLDGEVVSWRPSPKAVLLARDLLDATPVDGRLFPRDEAAAAELMSLGAILPADREHGVVRVIEVLRGVAEGRPGPGRGE